MLRQPFILFLLFLFGPSIVFSAADETPTILVPTEESVSEPRDTPTNTTLLQDQGLETDKNTHAVSTDSFHLAPRASVTGAIHQAYDFDEHTMHTWGGLHIAPWMGATYRIQLGVDIYSHFGWWQAAYHVLQTRNANRLYWGGGVATIVDGREDLRPLLKLKNYYLFVVGGWDFQINHNMSWRLEASAHKSTEYAFLRATAGLTWYF
ncbi:MAG: hypothetical protein H6623_04865 [Bdellovibrionaceae bacterium]|nr:hypothetical protein [Pseudobdellovibrionaceae bacterium]